jgi:uncharacterized protein with von Willebrand factor type A (vWA) domain
VGTRLGGAVVVVLSGGWERGDPELLAARMRRLHRLAHRVIRADPRKAPRLRARRRRAAAAPERLAAVVKGADDA